jgi:hypothetical protein
MLTAAAAPTSDLLPAWIDAVAAAVGVLVAIAALVFAYSQIRQTAKQMRLTAVREAQDSEERTRPYVGIDLVPGLGGSPSFDIVIENFGQTTARDIHVALAGAEFAAQSPEDEVGPALGRLFEVGFDLAPRARRRIFWRFPADEHSTPSGDMGAPVSGEVTARYSWNPGGDREQRTYEERLRYDLTEYPKLTPMAERGAKANGPDAEAKNLVHAVRAIATHVGELRR